MLIQDCTLLDNLQIISENKGPNGTMKIRGVFQRADELNANKRLYKKTLLESSISKIRPLIEGRMLLGELDHPEASVVRLSSASHLITSLKMKGNEMIGEAEILNTPAGKIVQTLIKDGVKIGISSRGTGTVTENRDGSREVNEDFKLITFDVVADPSTRGAYPQLAESKKLDMQDTLKRTFGEKVFVTLLKEELDEGSLGFQRARRIAKSKTASPEQKKLAIKKDQMKFANSRSPKAQEKSMVAGHAQESKKDKKSIIMENLKILLRLREGTEVETPTTVVDTAKKKKVPDNETSSYWVRQHNVAKKFGYNSAAKKARENYRKFKNAGN